MSAPPPRDPIVYMYLNTVTEMVYVGSSLYGLEHRHRKHLKAMAKKAKPSRFYRALRDWPDELWQRVVLERCTTEEELDGAERRWIAECGAMETGVGYNTYDSRYLRTSLAGGKAMQERGARSATTERQQKKERFAALSPGEKAAFFRACGQRGAEATAKLRPPKKRSPLDGLTPEQIREFYREAGKRGAQKSRELATG